MIKPIDPIQFTSDNRLIEILNFVHGLNFTDVPKMMKITGVYAMRTKFLQIRV